MLKKIFLVCMMIFSLSMPYTNAQDNIKVGYVDMPSFFTTYSRNSHGGYAYCYLEMLSGYANWSYTYIPGTWEQCVNRLQNGEIDIMVGSPGDIRELDNVSISKISIGHLYRFLALKKDDTEHDHTYRIGTLSSSTNDITFENMAARTGLSYELSVYDSYLDMNRDYDNGVLDGFISLWSTSNDQTTYNLFDVEPVYLLTQADNTALFDKLTLAMNYMDIFDPNLRTRLSTKFYAETQQERIPFTPEEKAYLHDKKKLIVLSSDNQKPYSYFENGEHKGVIAAIMNIIAKDLGIELEVIPLADDTNSYDMIANGDADIISDVNFDISAALNNHVRLTTPYMSVDYVPVTRVGGDSKSNPKVACLSGHLYTKNFVEPMYSANDRIYYSTIKDCLDAVSNHHADVTYLKSITATYNILQGNYLRLKAGEEIVYSHDVSIAMNENADPRLLSILNKEIKYLNSIHINNVVSTETINSIQSNTLAFSIYHYPLQMIILISTIAFIIIVIAAYISYTRQKHTEQIASIAYNDYFTGLKNRRWFEETAPDVISKFTSRNTSEQMAIAVFGITNWMLLSEIHGRNPLATQLKVWAENLKEKNWVSKLCVESGNGQVIILAHGENASTILTNINDLLESPRDFEYNDIELHTNIKAGISLITDDCIDVQYLISCAKIAYNEIQSLKLKLKVFDTSMSEQLKLRQRIEECMDQALEDHEYELWLQPKYEIATHKCIGAEALVRWTSSQLGKLFPDQFIPVFERTGFVLQLDFYMLEQACKWLRNQLNMGKPVVTISVNQSRLHMNEENYISKVMNIINAYEIPTNLIELELLETAFDMDNVQQKKHALEVINSLHELGFKISMDDFGSGYSSVMLLNALPLDVMKLDKTMLNESQGSDRMTTILRNCIRMGHELNMQIICEGIETAEQEQLLLDNGCHYGQGYFFSRPMPNADFSQFLIQHI